MISPFFCPPPGPHHLIGWLSLKAQSQSLIEMSESGRELGGGGGFLAPYYGGDRAGCTSVLFLARLVEARSCTQGV